MVEFLHKFVHEDLAVIVGIGYWFANCIIFAALIISGLNLTSYWSVSTAVKSIPRLAIPVVLLTTNAIRVSLFGSIQVTLGVLKSALLVVLFGFMIAAAARRDDPSAETIISQGIQHDEAVAGTDTTAVFMSISLAIFQFIGLETIATMSFETYRPSQDITLAVKNLRWIVPFYFVVALLISVSVSWRSSQLSVYDDQLPGGLVPFPLDNGTTDNISAPLVATISTGLNGSVVSAILLFCALSSANMALYAASRSLFGLATMLQTARWLPYKLISCFGVVGPRSRTPEYAVLVSGLLFIWLPTTLSTMEAGEKTKFTIAQTLLNIATVNCILVWCSQCFAYIRFHSYRTKYASRLHGKLSLFRKLVYNIFGLPLKPYTAVLSLVGCFVILLGFNQVSLYNSQSLGCQVVSAHLSPVIALVSWLSVKLYRWHSHLRSSLLVDLSTFESFRRKLLDLHDNIHPSDYPTRLESTRPPDDTTREMRAMTHVALATSAKDMAYSTPPVL